MHVMVVTGGQQLSHIRISFPTVNNVDLPPPEFPNPESFPPTNVNEAGPPPIGTVRRPCHSIGNVELVLDIIQQFFGFTSTKASPAPTSGFVHILPYPGPNTVPVYPYEVHGGTTTMTGPSLSAFIMPSWHLDPGKVVQSHSFSVSSDVRDDGCGTPKFKKCTLFQDVASVSY